MKRGWSRTAVALSSVVLLGSVPLLAQTNFASFTGIVASKDGNPVAGVEVTATNVATGVAYTARSNEAGLYTVSALPIGTYKVRAKGANFQAYETNPIKLESAQIARVDITLQVGVSESVEVTGVAPILQTQDAVVGAVISESTISNMPLNGRNFSQLSLLLPGVVSTDPNSFSEPKNFGSGRPNVNGQREQENNYMLDGVDMNEVIDNLLPYQPNTDALAEVRVDTNNYSAEFGNVAGAVIGSTIKSGTNEIHGNAFEYWRDSSLAANSFFNNRAGAKKAELSQHIFGGTLGGPIVKNKIFFFGDYQGFVRNVPSELVRTVAPRTGGGGTSRMRGWPSSTPGRVSPSPATRSRRAGSAPSRGRFSPTRISIPRPPCPGS